MRRTVLAVLLELLSFAFLAFAQAVLAQANLANTAGVQLLQRVPPTYPPLAQQARIQGTVVLDVVIGTDGSVNSATVVSGHPMLVQSAVDAVKQWKYKPYVLDGRAVDVKTRINVQFALENRPATSEHTDTGKLPDDSVGLPTRGDRETFATELGTMASKTVGHRVETATGGSQADGIVIKDTAIHQVQAGAGFFSKEVGVQLANLGFHEVYLTNGAQWWCNKPDATADNGWWVFGLGGPFASGNEAASKLKGLAELHTTLAKNVEKPAALHTVDARTPEACEKTKRSCISLDSNRQQKITLLSQLAIQSDWRRVISDADDMDYCAETYGSKWTAEQRLSVKDSAAIMRKVVQLESSGDWNALLKMIGNQNGH